MRMRRIWIPVFVYVMTLGSCTITPQTRSQLKESRTTFIPSAVATKHPAFLTPLPEEHLRHAAHLPKGFDLKLPWEGAFRISNGYGYESGSWTHQTIGNNVSANDFFAIDVPMPIGVPILAAADGRILTSQDRSSLDSYGKYVVIDHGKGIRTIYAHLDQLEYEVERGKPVVRVKQGQRIGTSGASGGQITPHLHFAVHQNSRLSASGCDIGGKAVVPEPISGYYGLRRGQTLESDNIMIE